MHYLVLFTLLALNVFALALPFDPSDPSTNATAHSLAKRGCKYDFGKPGWVCDDEIPKLAELVKQLQDEPGGKAKPGSRAVFYSARASSRLLFRPTHVLAELTRPGNLDDPNIGADKNNDASWVVGWLNANGFSGKYYWWADSVNVYWITAQANHIRDNQEKNKAKWGENAISNFNQCFYQALALAAQHGDAYLMIAGDKEPKPGSVWERVEFPSLTTNPKIKRIYRVDPRPPKERGAPDDCEPDEPKVIWDRAKDKPVKPQDLPWKCPWL